MTALVFLVAGAMSWGLGTGQPDALAAVQHGLGFRATVLGWTSWYGSYGLGDLGFGWCIDHGSKAPDADYRYVQTDVADRSEDAKAAVAWAVTSHAFHDAIGGAAVMLAVHDLMGAVYPAGRLDVDGLVPSHLSGFGGNEGTVIAKARSIKAEARAHAHLRGPYQLTLEAQRVQAGQTGRLYASLRDSRGAAVANAPIWFSAIGSDLGTAPTATDANGSIEVTFVAGPGYSRFAAIASVPDSTLLAYAPTTTAAQRIAKPNGVRVDAFTDFQPATTSTTAPTTSTTTRPPATTTTKPPTTTTTRPPTTTSSSTTSTPPTTTTSSSTTTTRPPTTTTRPPTTTTTTPPTTATPTTLPPSTLPPTTVPPTTSTTAPTLVTVPVTSTDRTLPPTTTMPETTTIPDTTTTAVETTVPETPTTDVSTPPPPPQPPAASPPATTTRGSLPFTGLRSSGVFFTGVGLLLLGGTLVAFSRHRRRQRREADRPWLNSLPTLRTTAIDQPVRLGGRF